jgi:hypothetical protein
MRFVSGIVGWMVSSGDFLFSSQGNDAWPGAIVICTKRTKMSDFLFISFSKILLLYIIVLNQQIFSSEFK